MFTRLALSQVSHPPALTVSFNDDIGYRFAKKSGFLLLIEQLND